VSLISTDDAPCRARRWKLDSDHVWSLDEMCAALPAQVPARKRIDKGLILQVLGEKVP
jgi:hypothetical protein